MILVIGKENCGSCEMVKNILKNKNIEYNYRLFDLLSEEDKTKYLNMARQAKKLSMPIIIKDDKIIDIKEVI